MYYSDDKKSVIRDVQRFLFVIGQSVDIPHLSVDGFYSNETAEAVRAFQGLYFLDVTGSVDKETFDLIYSEYVRINAEADNKNEFESSTFPIKIGDSGNAVSVLNALISELSRFYRDLPKPYGNFYSKDTEAGVKALQRYLRREESGEASAEFINAIKKELTQRQKFVSVNIS